MVYTCTIHIYNKLDNSLVIEGLFPLKHYFSDTYCMIEQRSLHLYPFTLPVGSVGAAWAAGVASIPVESPPWQWLSHVPACAQKYYHAHQMR
jgi:hypothetical protein